MALGVICKSCKTSYVVLEDRVARAALVFDCQTCGTTISVQPPKQVEETPSTYRGLDPDKYNSFAIAPTVDSQGLEDGLPTPPPKWAPPIIVNRVPRREAADLGDFVPRRVHGETGESEDGPHGNLFGEVVDSKEAAAEALMASLATMSSEKPHRSVRSRGQDFKEAAIVALAAVLIFAAHRN